MNKQGILRDKYFWAALGVGGFFLSLTIWFIFTMDQAIFHYVAWVWRQYSLPPYIGAWDLSFPGIFLIHRFVLAVFGGSIFGFRLFDFFVQLGSLAMIFYLSKRLSGSSAAGFFSAVVYGVYYFSLGPLETGDREGFVLFLLLAALIIGLNLERRFWMRALLCGLLAGFAFTLKPTFGLAWPVFAVWFLIQGFRPRPRLVLVEVAAFFAACLAPTIAFIFYYWRAGRLGDLYYANLYFNFKVYSRTTLGEFSGAGRWLSIPHSVFLHQPALIFFGWLGILIPFPKDQRRVFWMLLMLALMSLASYIIQAKYFPYHLIPFCGLIAVWSGTGIVSAGSLAKRPGSASSGIAGIFYALLMLLMFTSIQPQLFDAAVRFAYRSPAKAYSAGNSYDAFYYRAAKQLRPIIGDSEMEYFGWHPMIPYLLHKKLPSRFCVVYHLLIRKKDGQITEMQKVWIKEYTQSVISARPRFFLVSDQVPGWDVFNLAIAQPEAGAPRLFPGAGEIPARQLCAQGQDRRDRSLRTQVRQSQAPNSNHE